FGLVLVIGRCINHKTHHAFRSYKVVIVYHFKRQSEAFFVRFRTHLLEIVGLPLVAEWINLRVTNEAPVAIDFEFHFHSLAIEVSHYLNAYKAWQSHLHQSISIYIDPYSILKIEK